MAGFEIGCLPPPERRDYTYKAVVSKPPVPPKWMVHVYEHPENGSEVTFCLDRLPKKRKEKLCYDHNAEIIGWGIYFSERLHRPMIVTAVFLFTLITGLIFGICWSLLEHDISSAWTLASWISSVGALGLSAWSTWATLT